MHTLFDVGVMRQLIGDVGQYVLQAVGRGPEQEQRAGDDLLVGERLTGVGVAARKSWETTSSPTSTTASTATRPCTSPMPPPYPATPRNPALTVTAMAERACAAWPGAGHPDQRPAQSEPYRHLPLPKTQDAL
ncbi:hypothetical protein AB0K68_36060 [Streptomyces sp. NPDC050698]